MKYVSSYHRNLALLATMESYTDDLENPSNSPECHFSSYRVARLFLIDPTRARNLLQNLYDMKLIDYIVKEHRKDITSKHYFITPDGSMYLAQRELDIPVAVRLCQEYKLTKFRNQSIIG